MHTIVDLSIYPIETKENADNIREAIEMQLNFPQVESQLLAFNKLEFDKSINGATLEFTVTSGFTTEISKTERKFKNMLEADLKEAIKPYKNLTIDYHIETSADEDIVDGEDMTDSNEDYDY
ncbi:hypothetical protein B6D60_11595 [candidate division KSB1 bacterium 4484_87]|nr:MAG: hypothetical protein B6D60_11595 [candidate division KSB1 bacterium 4484_87]